MALSINPQLQGVDDAHWVMAYNHKTESFKKNGGQQKCLDKALLFRLFVFSCASCPIRFQDSLIIRILERISAILVFLHGVSQEGKVSTATTLGWVWPVSSIRLQDFFISISCQRVN